MSDARHDHDSTDRIRLRRPWSRQRAIDRLTPMVLQARCAAESDLDVDTALVFPIEDKVVVSLATNKGTLSVLMSTRMAEKLAHGLLALSTATALHDL